MVYNWLRIRDAEGITREEAARTLGENVRTLDDYLWRICWGLDHSFDFVQKMDSSIGVLIKAQKRGSSSVSEDSQGGEGQEESKGKAEDS